MGRTPCCPKVGVNRGAWCGQEDRVLTTYINANGEGSWKSLPQKAGLNRCGKSCRLRWINYLKPGIKRGGFTLDEDDLLIKLHNLLGNRWALIAGRLPGRTDNEIKNYWNTSLSKKAAKGNAPQNQGPHCPEVEYILQQPRSTDDQQQVVHRTKAYRCKKVILPAGLKTSEMLLSEEEAEEHQWSNVMQNEEMRSLVISQDEAGDGSAGSSSSALFSFSPELVLSRDFEAMPDWAALEKMASFLDLEVDEWNSLF